MKVSNIFTQALREGNYVVSNKSGRTKRFKDADSKEAKDWSNSTTTRKEPKITKYSDIWWKNLYFSKTYRDVYPDDKIREIDLDLIDFPQVAIGKNSDITIGATGKMEVDKTTCATADLHILTEFDKDDDLGLDDKVVDLIKIRVRRDRQTPSKLVLVKYL